MPPASPRPPQTPNPCKQRLLAVLPASLWSRVCCFLLLPSCAMFTGVLPICSALRQLSGFLVKLNEKQWEAVGKVLWMECVSGARGDLMIVWTGFLEVSGLRNSLPESVSSRMVRVLLLLLLCFNVNMVFFIVQVELSPFSHHHFPHPSHPHLRPLIPPSLGLVPVSFVDVPENPSPFPPHPSIPSRLPSGHCQFVLTFNVSG